MELVYQGYEGTDKLTLAYQTKDYDNAPDINVGLTSTIPSVMEMGWSVSAEELMKDSDSEITKDSFYEQLQRACSSRLIRLTNSGSLSNARAIWTASKPASNTSSIFSRDTSPPT